MHVRTHIADITEPTTSTNDVIFPSDLHAAKILSALQGFRSIAPIHRSHATLMRLETKVLTDPHQVSNPVRMNIAKRTLKCSTEAGPTTHPRQPFTGA
jgi:hypothetical protein